MSSYPLKKLNTYDQIGIVFNTIQSIIFKLKGYFMIDKETLDQAEILVDEGNSIRKTAKLVGVPYTSLRYALESIDKLPDSKFHIFNKDFFDIIDSEDKAYWLGYLAADGSLTSQKNSKRINLSIKESDRDHLLKYKNSLNLDWLPKKKRIFLHSTNKEYFAYRYIITSTKIFNDLVDKGITERKSLTLEPPKNVPQDLIRHWIRGYFDGDGSVFIDERDQKYQISIRGTVQVLTFIKSFIYTENELPNKALAQDIRKDISCYRLAISSLENRLKFYESIIKDSTIFLDRKKEMLDLMYKQESKKQ